MGSLLIPSNTSGGVDHNGEHHTFYLESNEWDSETKTLPFDYCGGSIVSEQWYGSGFYILPYNDNRIYTDFAGTSIDIPAEIDPVGNRCCMTVWEKSQYIFLFCIREAADDEFDVYFYPGRWIHLPKQKPQVGLYPIENVHLLSYGNNLAVFCSNSDGYNVGSFGFFDENNAYVIHWGDLRMFLISRNAAAVFNEYAGSLKHINTAALYGEDRPVLCSSNNPTSGDIFDYKRLSYYGPISENNPENEEYYSRFFGLRYIHAFRGVYGTYKGLVSGANLLRDLGKEWWIVSKFEFTPYDKTWINEISSPYLIDLTGLDYSSVKYTPNHKDGAGDNDSGSLRMMFRCCSFVNKIVLGDMSMARPTTMLRMFEDCPNLRDIMGLDTLNTTNTIDTSYMFVGCSSLETLDLTSFDTNSIMSMISMFEGCSSLKQILVSDKFDVSNVQGSANMFRGCTSLPNFDPNIVDKTKACDVSQGGYLTVVKELDDYSVKRSSLVSVGDVIRSRIKTEKKLSFPYGYINEIENIPYTTIDGNKVNKNLNLKTINVHLDLGDMPKLMQYGFSVVVNGQIHILGSADDYDSTTHYKFNGDYWTEISTLPFSLDRGGAVVLNNEIHILGGNGSYATNHYKFDGSNWTEVSTLPSVPFKYNCGSAVVLNNEIHMLGNTSHFIFNGTNWFLKNCLPYNYGYGAAVVLDDEIHLLGSSDRSLSDRHFVLDSKVLVESLI